MTKQKLWELIEAYRMSGGSEEHHARKEQLDAVLDGLLAQPEEQRSCDKQEPVAVVNGVYANRIEWKCTPKFFPADGTNLYTTPPQEQRSCDRRKPLTDEEISRIWGSYFSRGFEFARAIEAAHGIKEKNT